MANIADCAFAVAKDELDKLKGAIYKLDKDIEGIEEAHTYDIVLNGRRHHVKRYEKYTHGGIGDSRSILFYEVDGYKHTSDVYEKCYPRGKWLVDYGTYKCVTDKAFCNGWCVDWQKLNSYSYEADTYVAEYDDHLTIHFGGRWDFPANLENALNASGIRWQGAGVEDGCDWECDEFGNYDFGLYIAKHRADGGDEPTYYRCIEDATE